MSAPDVVVIGAGFAGLAAATALAEAGAAVQVFEARPGLGGRATGYRDPVTGERIDNGQHVLAGCYTETLRFLDRIGAGSALHRPSSLRVPMIDESRTGERAVAATAAIAVAPPGGSAGVARTALERTPVGRPCGVCDSPWTCRSDLGADCS